MYYPIGERIDAALLRSLPVFFLSDMKQFEPRAPPNDLELRPILAPVAFHQ